MPLTNIQILRSAVPYKRPDPTFLLDGQLAINYKIEEPGLFAKLQDGGMFKIGPTAITTNGDAPNANPAPDGVAGNLLAEKWFDQRAVFHSGVEKIWDGVQWLPVSGFTIDDATGDMTMLRALTVDTLNADAVNINGPLSVNGNITPAGTTCVHDLGLAAERWNGVFGCSLDILNDAQIGNDLVVVRNQIISGSLAVDGNLNVNGDDNTFGQSCADIAFTVESPAFLNCDTSIIGDITAGGSLDMAGDLTVDGTIQLGSGCGVSALTVDADTTFNCPVTFAGNLFSFGDGCATSIIEFNGSTRFGCDSVPLVGSSVDMGAAATPFRAVYADNLEGGIFNGDSMSLTGKAVSATTVAGDLGTTLTTKDYVDQEIFDAVNAATLWERIGTNLRPTNPNDDIVPNGQSDIGLVGAPFTTAYINNINGVALTLTGKGSSDSTVDADPGDTLTTKDYVNAHVLDQIANEALWERVAGDLRPVNINEDIIPNGLTNLGNNAQRFPEGFFNNIYTNDLHLKNDRGDWTMIEEEDCLTLRNNKTGKRFAISMTPYPD